MTQGERAPNRVPALLLPAGQLPDAECDMIIILGLVVLIARDRSRIHGKRSARWHARQRFRSRSARQPRRRAAPIRAPARPRQTVAGPREPLNGQVVDAPADTAAP